MKVRKNTFPLFGNSNNFFSVFSYRRKMRQNEKKSGLNIAAFNHFFTAMSQQQSGIAIKGAVRDILLLKQGNRQIMLWARNNEEVEIVNYSK
jgi:hypothetical protein